MKPIICIHCREPIAATDRRDPWMEQAHWECGLRAVVGGINHLNRLCSCCGGTLPPDPDNVSKRDAARMAAQAWIARNPH